MSKFLARIMRIDTETAVAYFIGPLCCVVVGVSRAWL